MNRPRIIDRQLDRPVRIPTRDGPGEFVYWELKDDMVPGDAVTAYRLRYTGTDAGDLERIDKDDPNGDYVEGEVRDDMDIVRGAGADDAASPDPIPGTIVLARKSGDAWPIVVAQPWPTMVRGVLTASLETTDSTFKLDGVSIMQPVGAIDVAHILDASGELTVYNLFGWEGDNNGWCIAAWNEAALRWEAIQVECPA